MRRKEEDIVERLTKRQRLIYKNNETNEIVKEEHYVVLVQDPYDTNTMLPNYQKVLERLADYEDEEECRNESTIKI